MKRSCLLLGLTVVLLMETAAHADLILFEQYPRHGGLTGSDSTKYLVADDFRVSEQAEITSFEFWAYHRPGGPAFPNNGHWHIRSDNNGKPGTILVSGRGFDAPGQYGRLHYHVVLPNPLLVEPDTTYWLSIHVGAFSYPTSSVTWYMVWEGSTGYGQGSGFRSWTGTGAWEATNFNTSFVINGNPVPEPVSMTLLVLGGLLPMRRRRA